MPESWRWDVVCSQTSCGREEESEQTVGTRAVKQAAAILRSDYSIFKK